MGKSIRERKLVGALKEYILEDVDKEEIVRELVRYRKEFSYELDYNWYQYGNILPYYFQIRDFYSVNGLECEEDTERMMAEFKRCLRTAIDEIIKENE